MITRPLAELHCTKILTLFSPGAELPLWVDPLAHLGPALRQSDEGQAGEVGPLREHAQLLKAPGLTPVLHISADEMFKET